MAEDHEEDGVLTAAVPSSTGYRRQKISDILPLKSSDLVPFESYLNVAITSKGPVSTPGVKS